MKLIIFLIAILAAVPVQAATRLGLHVTSGELAVWQDRMVNGPYKTAGDVSTNSPGDWTRILAAANAGSLSTLRWTGMATSACWTTAYNTPPRHYGERLRDTAFAYLITGTLSYRTAALAELLAQAGTAGTDFSNTTRWCSGVYTTSPSSNGGFAWEVGMWLTKVLFAYDYILAGDQVHGQTLSGSDQTTLNTWFLNAANFWEGLTHEYLNDVFPNRLSDDYTTMGPGWTPTNLVCTGGSPCILYFGGPGRYAFHEFWNNRMAQLIRFAALVGIQQNSATLKARGKRWFNEWLRFAVWPDGTISESNRWNEGTQPAVSFSYMGAAIGSMVTMADAFARIGDLDLYDRSESTGHGTQTPAGGPKTLLTVMQRHQTYMNGGVTRYGTTNAANNGNANYLIDSIDGISGETHNADVWYAHGNVYYQDATVKACYMRTCSGAPAYPASPFSGGYGAHGGEWGIFPGILFQFGQMEDSPANPFFPSRLGAAGRLRGRVMQ
jgi:hypothetical protein